MKPKKTKEIQRVLCKKGFEQDPKSDHHNFYYLIVDGKKKDVRTYFSHSKNEYDAKLLSKMKNQLFFETSDQFEQFLECTFSGDDYVQMLVKNHKIRL